MQNSGFVCSICLTQKHTKSAFNEHFAWCSRIHTSNKENIAEIDAHEKPLSIQQLSILIRQLACENDVLKKEISKLKQNGNIQRRRMIDEWLEMDINRPSHTYSEWLKTIIAKREYVLIAMKSDLRDGIKACLENAFTEKMPIRAFTQKPNTLYIYDIMEEGSKPKWRIISTIEMNKMILILSHRFLNEYMNWEDENADEIENDESLKKKQIDYLTNVNGGKITMDTRINDIKRWIFMKIQENIKNVEY